MKTELSSERRKTTRIYPAAPEPEPRSGISEGVMNQEIEEEDFEEYEDEVKSPFSFGKALMMVFIFHVVLLIGALVFSTSGFFSKTPAPPSRNQAKATTPKVLPEDGERESQFAGVEGVENDKAFLHGGAEKISSQALNSQPVRQPGGSSSWSKQPETGAPPQGQANISGTLYYVVRKGDTLSAISRTTGLGIDEIMELNGISNPNLIKVGQQLLLSNGRTSGQLASREDGFPESSSSIIQRTTTPATHNGSVVASSGGISDQELRQLWERSDKNIVPSIPQSAEEFSVQEVSRVATPVLQTQVADLPIRRAESLDNGNASSAIPQAGLQNHAAIDGPGGDFSSPTPPSGASSYVLGAGDNLYSVARKLNVSYEELRTANGINNPREIMIGQVLHVP